MKNVFLQEEEIRRIFESHIQIDYYLQSINDLFSTRNEKKIVYNPYYQRNYVWDNDKASYFIESILLGTEIPPLVFFNRGTNDAKNIEIIDGRQRFETIKRFKDNKINLSEKGLTRLKELGKRGKNNFDSLSLKLSDLFLDTNIRIIEFKVVNEPRLDPDLEDKIKKEIFRRYNSGITPLKTVEIDNAIYNEDNLTSQIKKELKENDVLFRQVIEVFFFDSAKDKKLIIEKALSKIRSLVVQTKMPVNYFAASRSNEISKKLYEIISNDPEQAELVFESFKKKIKVLKRMKTYFDLNNIPSNKLVFEGMFWGLSILENEIKEQDILSLIDEGFVRVFAEKIHSHLPTFNTDNSYIYKEILNRYNFIAALIKDYFKIDVDLYISYSTAFKDEIKNLKHQTNEDISAEELEEFRLVRPDPSTKTINLVLEEMERKRFFIRPTYQRGEAINKPKAAALIESILLGIKLPPIFLFKKADAFGTSEVIDGQQRLLSIIGFIGKEFLDEHGNRVKSEKNGYALSNLRILTNLNGKRWTDLSEAERDKILDFKLSLVIIDQKVNPNFQAIDLFIRLNNKPYPIRENTFEMWNSYIDKDVIKSIKENTVKHLNWFFVRAPKKNKDFDRMENEELYTSLAYLEYHKNFTTDRKLSGLDMYQKIDRINIRIKQKNEITTLLTYVSQDETAKNNFGKCIKNVESFIRKLRLILLDKDVAEKEQLITYYKEELDRISQQKEKAPRTQQTFYLLWHFLNDINLVMVEKHRLILKEEIKDIFRYMRSLTEEQASGKGVFLFLEKIDSIKNKYRIEERKLRLTDEQKNALIKSNNNKSPLSGSPIFIGDEINVDHIVPLALGGADKIENLQPSHPRENKSKGAKS